ncbi:NADH-dependent flavin oxidoreductase [Bacillus sp. IITD106]|nr:NADH-dependent flavin oxidoreductase [Bacillus sp. IITD106]
MKESYRPIFEPYTLPNGIQLKNRIIMAPMTHASSNLDGTVSETEINYYVRRAKGLGMVIVSSTKVMANGGFPGTASADRDEMIPGLRRLALAIQSEGAKSILQITHAGRKCPPFVEDIVSASAIPESKAGAAVPRELTAAEIPNIIRAFGEAARRAIEAGFDGVEIHGANGDLIQQFFSPHSNRRNDRWGGSLEKRMTFPLAVVDEVIRVVRQHTKKPFIVGYRLSPEEMGTPGIMMSDTLNLIEVLASKELDYVHISQNDFWSTPKRGVDDTRPNTEIIQERAGRLPVIGNGSIRTAEKAVQALQTGIPLIALGRELVMEPDWMEKIAQGREDDIKTTLSKADQHKMAIPDSLWGMIMRVPGWFPIEIEA